MPLRTDVLAVATDGEPHAHIERAAALLRAGRLVAFPTETVYGLGADATNEQAVERIFVAKGRPHSDPLIVHVPDVAALERVVVSVPLVAQTLAERFWPGPLTLVLPRAASIPALVAAGGDTVGVRIPSSPVALALLGEVGTPVAAPSANRFTHTSPTTAAHVLADLDGRIDCILDGGPCAVGVESTVLDLTISPPRILRPGGVSLEALQAVLPDVAGPLAQPMEAVAHAPGQMERHYSPRTPLIVFHGAGQAALDAIVRETGAASVRGERVGALLPDEEARTVESLGVVVERLGLGDDLAEVSRRLYAALRALDAANLAVIYAHTFPTAGLGLAINDRLRRAAGGALREI